MKNMSGFDPLKCRSAGLRITNIQQYMLNIRSKRCARRGASAAYPVASRQQLLQQNFPNKAIGSG